MRNHHSPPPPHPHLTTYSSCPCTRPITLYPPHSLPPPQPPPHRPPSVKGRHAPTADGTPTFYTCAGGFFKLTKLTDYGTKVNACKWPYHGLLYIILKLISKQKRWYVVHSLPVHKECAGENLYIKETNRH